MGILVKVRYSLQLVFIVHRRRSRRRRRRQRLLCNFWGGFVVSHVTLRIYAAGIGS